MALAILKLNKREHDKYVLEADIGTNTWYEFRTGTDKRKHRGMDFIDGVQHQSAMLKAPVENNKSFQTHFIFSIPATMFDKEVRFIQLFSYKDKGKASPAISEVLTIVPAIADLTDDFKLPKMMTRQQEKYDVSPIEVRNAPFRIKENRVSEAFFFNALLGAIPGLLSNALPMLGKILPQLQSAAPAIGNIADTAGKLLPELTKIIPQDVKPGAEGVQQVLQNISPDTIKAILEIIQSQEGQSSNGGNGHSTTKSMSRFSHDFAINPAMLLQLAPLLEKVLSPETIKAIGDNPVQLFKAVSDSALKFQKMELDHLEKINPSVEDAGFDKVVQGMRYKAGRYSEAKIAPALLAALPALMPILEKVLSPDMIKAIGEQPIKLFNAIADAGLKHTQQELQHLEKINPGVNDAAFDNIVNSMNVKSAVTINATFSDAISIKFLNSKTLTVAGKEKVIYDKRQKVTFPVQLMLSHKSQSNGRKNVSRGIFQLIIQDPDDMDVLFEKKYKMKDIPLGSPIANVSLNSDEMKGLPAGKNLKVELTFNWKKGEKTYGTFINHYITLTEGYVFQRASDNLIKHFVLNDVNLHRNYWHKVWEGSPASHERWKIDFECKYFYSVNDEDASIQKLATRKRIVSDSGDQSNGDSYRRKITAKLKSGMEISLQAYNELLKIHQLTPLTDEQLQAFKSHEFVRGAAVAARVSVDFRGRKGETSALWIYPEGNIQSYVLGKVVSTDASGMVTELQEEEVHFPKLSSAHFIGTQSE